MNKSLTRSIGFWLLLVLSIASAGVGGWIVSGQVGTMTSTLLDGTATGVEVYVGQSLVVVGAAFVGAGLIGILIAIALGAVQAMLPVAGPAALEPIDWTAQNTESVDDAPAASEPIASDLVVDETSAVEDSTDDATPDAEEGAQNGSSGSIATATKISVK